MIKFLDLQKINAQYEQELKEAANRVIDSGWYLLGKKMEQFEKNYADFCGTKYAIGVANRLDAHRLIFKAYIEIAYAKGFINETQLQKSITKYGKSGYGGYLKRLLK